MMGRKSNGRDKKMSVYMVMSFIGRPRLIVYIGQIPRDGITSENYFRM